MEKIIPLARNYDGSVENTYYDAYVEGCMSIEGNTRDMCESATDAD